MVLYNTLQLTIHLMSTRLPPLRVSSQYNTGSCRVGSGGAVYKRDISKYSHVLYNCAHNTLPAVGIFTMAGMLSCSHWLIAVTLISPCIRSGLVYFTATLPFCTG